RVDEARFAGQAFWRKLLRQICAIDQGEESERRVGGWGLGDADEAPKRARVVRRELRGEAEIAAVGVFGASVVTEPCIRDEQLCIRVDGDVRAIGIWQGRAPQRAA